MYRASAHAHRTSVGHVIAFVRTYTYPWTRNESSERAHVCAPSTSNGANMCEWYLNGIENGRNAGQERLGRCKLFHTNISIHASGGTPGTHWHAERRWSCFLRSFLYFCAFWICLCARTVLIEMFPTISICFNRFERSATVVYGFCCFGRRECSPMIIEEHFKFDRNSFLRLERRMYSFYLLI